MGVCNNCGNQISDGQLTCPVCGAYTGAGVIAFLENNLQADGRVRIPEALRMYMGGKEYIG